ncbi:hypothetical protein PTE30175_02545 [Pandoraea terrae]|uniref:DUF4224 domain-containing protein n=1 Tax=Pandoraea terrae TaxID=1537710 RepID=A0A5E4VGH4_9BURK|nr:DUF4224 domain-containing protein [Pandoraea terrae]VVE10664.1 hypothetical protein PTE30175_02545 [Pandoraea terrae]
MSQTFLTQDEVRELTGRTKFKSQDHVLSVLGIEHKVRPDGSMIVLRAHVEQLLGCGTSKRPRSHEYEIDRSLM